MASGRDEQELREQFEVSVGARLAPLGWEILQARESSFRLAAFRRALDGPFAAIAEVVCPARIIGARLPLEVTGVSVGVSYEPLRVLGPLLDRFDCALVEESVWPSVGASDSAAGAGERSVRFSAPGEADRTAEVVAGEVSAHAVSFAERHADLDALLAQFSASLDERDRLTPAALLAAAGRSEEALARLDALAVEPTERNRADRRVVYQLRRWIAHHGDPALIPARFPPRRGDGERAVSFSESWREYQKMRVALNEFRAQAAGKPREQARAILHDTLIRHSRLEQGPIWIEEELDRLETSSGERVRSGLHILARIGIGAARAIQDRKLPDFFAPSQLEPPDHALYQVPHTTARTAVILDPQALDWLLNVYHDARRYLEIARFTVWLQKPDASANPLADLEVFLADRRIGTITREAQPHYADLVADAAARGEHPCLDAYLTLHGDELIIAIGKPTQDPARPE